jgi:TolB protein
LKELEKVIAYDFSNNGKTKLVSRSLDRDKTLSIALSKTANGLKSWKETGIPYGIKFFLEGKKLHVCALSIVANTIKSISEVSLTGNLIEDRRAIHKIADAVHLFLFNEPGIANSRILYSYHNRACPESSQNISEIWECDWDGANARQVTKENTYCVTPVLLPRGPQGTKDMFLYVNYKTGQPKIYISAIDGSHNSKAVDIRGNQLLPAISSKRDQMAFICDASGRADLFVQSIEPFKWYRWELLSSYFLIRDQPRHRPHLIQ